MATRRRRTTPKPKPVNPRVDQNAMAVHNIKPSPLMQVQQPRRDANTLRSVEAIQDYTNRLLEARRLRAGEIFVPSAPSVYQNYQGYQLYPSWMGRNYITGKARLRR